LRIDSSPLPTPTGHTTTAAPATFQQNRPGKTVACHSKHPVSFEGVLLKTNSTPSFSLPTGDPHKTWVVFPKTLKSLQAGMSVFLLGEADSQSIPSIWRTGFCSSSGWLTLRILIVLPSSCRCPRFSFSLLVADGFEPPGIALDRLEACRVSASFWRAAILRSITVALSETPFAMLLPRAAAASARRQRHPTRPPSPYLHPARQPRQLHHSAKHF